MLVNLPESVPHRKRSFGGTAVSTLVHALVIGGSLVATGEVAQRVSEPDPPAEIFYVKPRPEQDPLPPKPAPPQHIPSNLENLTPVEAPVVDLGRIPDVLPPTNAVIGTISARDFQVAPRDSIPTGPVAPVSNEPLTEMMVEQAVRPRDGNPAPRYPSMLASAGVEGVVYAHFVVDTAGRVEPGSIRFPKSDHQLFERAVREVLLRSRFSPALVGNRPVRQLVEQAFSFNLTR
jgi:TonB family protein